MFVSLYGTKNCKYCDMAKNFLTSKGIEFDYTDVSDPEEKANLALRMGHMPRSVPQVFIDNKHVGGYNELKAIVG